MSAVQLAARQMVAPSGNVHAVGSVPPQAPPQTEPSLAQGWREPCGGPATATQVPSFPATSQASHCPRQEVPQQKPSAHSPDEHWAAAVQGAPSGWRGTQTPPEQNSEAAQSPSPRQPPPQIVPVHPSPPQLWVCAVGQEPVPSQNACKVAVSAVQLAARHSVPAPGRAQVTGFVPSQVPPQTDPSVAHADLVPTGAPKTGEQVPSVPV